MTDKLKNIFPRTDCISEVMLQKYVSGNLSSDEKHVVEMHLTDCEMCSDAVEGLQKYASPLPSPKEREQTIQNTIAELNERIQELTKNKKTGTIIFLREYRTQLAVAASIILILGLIWIFRSNTSLDQIDPASAEKMFAEKFEPYPSESNVPAVSEPEKDIADAEKTEETQQAPARKEKQLTTKTVAETEITEDSDNNTKMLAKKNIATPSAVKLRDENAAAAPSSAGSGTAREELSKITIAEDAEEPEQKASSKKDISGSKAEDQALAAAADISESEPGKKSKALKQARRAETKTAAPESYYEMAAGAPIQQEKMALQDKNTAEPDSVSAGDRAMNLAMRKYNEQDYSGAANDFEKILKENPDDEKALFYSAVSYLGLGQTDKTILHLNKVLQNKSSVYYDAALWYLSLAYIKANDIKNARANLKQIQNNPGSKYQKQSEQMLKDLPE